MKFRNYILEQENNVEEIVEIIKRDCKPFLKEFNKPLYRGTHKKIKEDIVKIIPRTDRRPKDLSIEWHEWGDKYFLERFGWKARSEGVFTSFSEWFASRYGKSYLFFPIGKYKYVYSKNIMDFYRVRTILPAPPEEGTNEYDVLMKHYMSTYTDKNASLFAKGHEIMFKCKSYYLIKKEYYSNIESALS